MNLPVIENRWTTGNLLSLAGLALAMVVYILNFNVAMTRMDEGLAQARAADLRQEAEIAAIRREAASTEVRIRAVEMGWNRTDEKLLNIISAVQRIERILEPRE